MFEAKLPQQINPLRLAQQGDILSGYVPTQEMSRVAASVQSMDERVRVELSFALDELNRAVAKGIIWLPTCVVCQRCLQPFEFDVKGEINWAFVKNDIEAKRIQDVYDPILFNSADSEKMDLYVQIEDEIILNLPMITLHSEVSICEPVLQLGKVSDIKIAEEPAKRNPFAELAKLKVVKKLHSKE